MSVALPALAIFLIALPGIIAIGSFQSELHSGQFDSWSITKQTAYGLVLAVGLHSLWIHLFPWFATEVNKVLETESASTVFAGLLGDPEAGRQVVDAVASAPGVVLGYFASLYALTWVGATLARILVNATGIHRHFPFLRYHDWYYVLRGELRALKGGFTTVNDVSGVYVTAVVDQANAGYLYRGLLIDFDLSENGDLKRIYLANAHRRDLEEDDAEKDPEQGDTPLDPHLLPHHDERYYVIRGDLLVVEYSHVKTLNVERIFLEPVEDDGEETETPANAPTRHEAEPNPPTSPS